MKTKRSKWKLVFRREHYPNFFHLSTGFANSIKHHNDYRWVYNDNGIINIYVKINEKWIKEIVHKFVASPSFFDKERNKVISFYDDAVKWAKDIRRRGFENLSQGEALSILIELAEWYEKIGGSIWIFHTFLEEGMETYLREKGLEGIALDEILASTSWHTQLSFQAIADEKLYKIASSVMKKDIYNKMVEIIHNTTEQIKNSKYDILFLTSFSRIRDEITSKIIDILYNDEEIRDTMKKYIFEYSSAEYDYGTDDFLDLHFLEGDQPRNNKYTEKMYRKLVWILAEENPSIKLENRLLDATRTTLVRKFLLKKAKFSDLMYKYANIISWASYIRLKRRTTITHIDCYAAPLFKKIVEKYNATHLNTPIPMADIRFLEINDFVNMLKDEEVNYNKKIRELKIGSVRDSTRGDRVIRGKEVEKYIDEFKKEGMYTIPSVDELYGRCRYYGEDLILTGRVKIVKKASDLRNIKYGDILLTLMVEPTYLEALDRVGGITTEEGSLTCHVLTLYNEFCWKFPRRVPVITDATKGILEALTNDDIIEIDLREEARSNGKVKIRRVRHGQD